LPSKIKNGKFIRIKTKDSPEKLLVLSLISEAHRFSRIYHHKLIKRSIVDL
jgi:hypothetical protein